MKRKYLLVFVGLLFLETLVLSTLALKIAGDKLKILGVSHTIELNKNAFDQNTETSFEGFYEPKIGAEEGLERTYPEWLKTEPVYHINSDGFNDRFDYQINKPEDAFRIITLGDSFTFGQYVDTKNNYPETLEELLNKSSACQKYKKFEVINLGVPDYDLEFDLERFRLRGQKYNPDMVLIFLKDDDFENLREFTGVKAKEIQQEISKNPNISTDHKTIWGEAYQKVIKDYSEEQITNYHKSALAKFRENYKGKVVLFTLAETSERWAKILEEFTAYSKDTFYYKNLPDIIKLNQVFPDTHPDTSGYISIADSLFNFIIKDSNTCN